MAGDFFVTENLHDNVILPSVSHLKLISVFNTRDA